MRETRGGEDVHHAFRLHGIVYQVTDRLFDRALLLAAGKRLSQLIPHSLAEDDFVGVLPAVVEVLHEQKGGREPHLCVEEVVTAHLVLGHDSVDQGIQILDLRAAHRPPRAVIVAGGQERPDFIEGLQEYGPRDVADVRRRLARPPSRVYVFVASRSSSPIPM